MKRSNESFERSFRMPEGNIKHEGMKCTEEEKELIKLRYLDLISKDGFIEKILKLANNEMDH